MIEAIAKIGERISNEFGGKSEIERKKEILKHLSRKVNKRYNKKAGKNYETIMVKKIILNLDTKNKKIDLVIDQDLREGDDLFVFSPQSPKGKKIDFNTNNLKYHINNTLPDLIRYIDEKYHGGNDLTKFKEYLRKLNKEFYKNGKLNFELIDDKEQSKNFEDLILKKLNITKGDYKNYSAFFLYIDGKDISKQPFFEDYVKVKYYQLIDQFFSGKKLVEGKRKSHLFNKPDKITKNVSFLTKFYMTHDEKPVFFENIEIRNTFKAFTVNKETFEKLLLGTDYIYKNLRKNIFGINYLIIPKSDNFIDNLKENVERIKNGLNSISSKGQQKDIEEKKIIQKHSNRLNWKFDLMFYEKDQSAFNVYKIISDLSYFNIEKISKTIIKLNDQIEDIKKYLFQKYPYNFNLNSIWGAYYSWTRDSGAKDKRKIYRSEMLDLLNSIYTLRKQNQKKIFRRVLYNLKKNYHYRDKNNSKKQRDYFKNENRVNTIILDITNYLNFLLDLNMMGNSKLEQERELFTKDISNKELKGYFDKNNKLFSPDIENGFEKQGLVILGYFVNKIIFAQKGKSKTFMDKINFDGIKKEDLKKKFVKQVGEYMNLYKKEIKYREDTLFAEMQERINNIEQSSLSKEEVVYYILLGNFLGKYIGIKRGTQKASEDEAENNKNSADVENMEKEDGN